MQWRLGKPNVEKSKSQHQKELERKKKQWKEGMKEEEYGHVDRQRYETCNN